MLVKLTMDGLRDQWREKPKSFQSWKRKQVKSSPRYLLLQNRLCAVKQQPFYYVHDFWDQEFRQGHRRGGLSALRCLGPPMRRLKWLRLAQMPGIIQRCLHSYVWRFVLAVSWDLSWLCWQGHHHSGLSDVTGFPHNMAAGFWGTARGEWVFQKTEAETGQLLLTWPWKSQCHLHCIFFKYYYYFKGVAKVGQIQGKGVRPFCWIAE